ncbi:hypothetical protein Noda2021_10630 [Candidatus Dependentiae bacterium Noda2021]|nr:hypothetical protein Noda2021_10630 [Candidatus Dependentiae bacterium Noda2021]
MSVWKILLVWCLYLPLWAQEQSHNNNYFECYQQSSNQHRFNNHELFLQPLHQIQCSPNTRDPFSVTRHVFAQGKYCVTTIINKDLQTSIFYIEQVLSYAAQPNIVLCSLKGSIIQNPWDNYLFVAHIQTPEQFQKQGYARSLMCNLEWLAANAGCKKITLNSTKNAIGFYQKMGYSYDTSQVDDFDETIPMTKKSDLFGVQGSSIYLIN